MKWFKHITDSLDDPFIFRLIEKHGGNGYMVFFGTLEIYAREFSVKDGWNLVVTLSYLKRKFNQTHRQLIVNPLQTISNSGKWKVKFNKDEITIFIPKFRQLMDESTLKKLREKEHSFRNRSGIVLKTDTTDADTDVDKDKRTKTCAEPEKDLDSTLLVLSIPLLKKDGDFLIFQEDISRWQETFPAVDILQTLREIRQWNLDNPTKRKTKTGVRKHISFWLGKEQNKGGNKKEKSEDILIRLKKKEKELNNET